MHQPEGRARDLRRAAHLRNKALHPMGFARTEITHQADHRPGLGQTRGSRTQLDHFLNALDACRHRQIHGTFKTSSRSMQKKASPHSRTGPKNTNQ